MKLNKQIKNLHSKEFNDKYYYDGELGAIYSTEQTVFKLWAPTAESVQLIDYTHNKNYDMQKQSRGVWEITLIGDYHLVEYNYCLNFADGSTEISTDPYARSLTANSLRTVVVDLLRSNPANWHNDRLPQFSGAKDAIIYEAHVRDLTIGQNNGIKNKGKFIGIAEEGTRTDKGNISGLDYISSLGISHVQLMPIYDFATVDECGDLNYNAQYNWGYDPLNYNVPEGSYITDANDPIKRILEPKQMIAALHSRKLRVIMDVVYNHAYTALNKFGAQYKSPLEKTVPGYYFRMKDDGTFYDGSFCGNEVASEQPMMRKYIVDSVSYWAREYHIDGFRFDLMGIIDVETMREIRKALDKIDSSIIILGEGWNMGNHPKGIKGANQNNINDLGGIAVFNDWYRNIIKGGTDKNDKGFINGESDIELSWALLNNIKGMQYNKYYKYNSPEQSVIYNEAHDNYTLYDQLSLTDYSEDEIIKTHALATITQYLANGIVFIHAGQEFLRTKQGDHNSYASADSINELDYDRASKYSKSLELFKKLNAFRKKYDFMRKASYDEINKSYTHDYMANTVAENHLSYKIKSAVKYGNKDLDAYVFINSAQDTWEAPIPLGKYDIIIKGMSMLEKGEIYESSGIIEVDSKSILLLIER